MHLIFDAPAFIKDLKDAARHDAAALPSKGFPVRASSGGRGKMRCSYMMTEYLINERG